MRKGKLNFWGKISLLFLLIFALFCSSIFTPQLTLAEGGNLLDLSVSEGKLSPNFEAQINEYTVDVANSVTSLDITALLDDPTEQQLFIQDEEQGNGIPWPFPLDSGTNNLSIEVYAPSARFSNTYTLTINRAEEDLTNADLWQIKTNVGALTPAFDPTIVAYTVNVPHIIKTIEIMATPADSSATLTINEGTQVNLEPGENLIPLTVTSGDRSTTKTYTLKVIRGPSSNANLKDLFLTTGSDSGLTLEPNFASHIATYTVKAPHIDNLNILPILEDPLATLTINGEEAQNNKIKTVNLDQGGNLIPLVVTAPDGVTEKAYVLSINGWVNNTDLASLSVQALDTEILDFDVPQTKYSFTVDYGVDCLTINTYPADPKALLMLNGSILPAGNNQEIDLAVGENSIQIMVIAQDTSTKTYTLDVLRKEALTIETNNLSLGLLGFPYTTTLTAQGGEKPYQWSALNLPAGLNLNSETGEITGIPENVGTYEVIFSVTDILGNNVTKNLVLQLNLGYGNGGYLLIPQDNPAYTIGHADNGFPILTIQKDISDLHIPIEINPVNGHVGEETVVFVLLRNNAQIGLNTAKIDFDLAPFAHTTFEVQTDDQIKVYIVDDLTSNPLLNPNIL